MDWIEIEIETTTLGSEHVAGLIIMSGFQGYVIQDPEDIKRLAEKKTESGWDYIEENLLLPDSSKGSGVLVTAYAAANSQGRGQLDELQARLSDLKAGSEAGALGSLNWRLKNVAEEDWANNWKAYFKPFPVGAKLVIKPTWESWDCGDDRLLLEIDPGSSFGTGQHQTTKLCLEMLEERLQPGDRVLDLGCGSGILLIAALLLGASFAAGVDIDENSLGTTEANLKQNSIQPERYVLLRGDLASDVDLRVKLHRLESRHCQEVVKDPFGTLFDLITANIVADVIIRMSSYFFFLLRPGGHLLVSGIIDERLDEVVDIISRSGLSLVDKRGDAGWHACLFLKQSR